MVIACDESKMDTAREVVKAQFFFSLRVEEDINGVKVFNSNEVVGKGVVAELFSSFLFGSLQSAESQTQVVEFKERPRKFSSNLPIPIFLEVHPANPVLR